MRIQRRLLTIVAILIVLLTASVAAAAPASLPNGMTGAAQSAFQAPPDAAVVWTAQLPGGLTQTRYQQFFRGARVLGGQFTVLQDKGGANLAVVGAHFSAITPTNDVRITPDQARANAASDVGNAGERITELGIDPETGRYFYAVETRRFDSRWVHWIDATNGSILKKIDALQHNGETESDPAIGVKGDTKQIDTTWDGTNHQMISHDGRQRTYDAGNTQFTSGLPGTLFSDPDGVWNFIRRTSPGQPAGVDAHYYANVTDDFYLETFGRNSLDNAGMTMVSSAHVGRNYNNASWNGEQMSYGDGDGREFREFSGGLDVVGHELTHGVTDFTSDLIYENESGALNEAFSDMMGNSIEFYAASKGLDPAAAPDWLLAEDISLVADAMPGFRNMSDPQEDDDPDHYSERYTGTADGGGVHTNSGIPNHAYYLLVNGGRNAGCDAVGSNGHRHTADCHVQVEGVGLAVAQGVFYAGFTSLPENSTIAYARTVTEMVAKALYGPKVARSVAAAWQAVGVARGAAPAPRPSCDVPSATIPFESAHPYANNAVCTYTYNNGAPNFAFHFSVLDVEKDFDYIDILDANDNVLATVTGTLRRGYTSPNIPTSVGKVRLRTDGSVVGQGFIVDAVIQP
jgi:Zn-dependent metalloprotease